MLGAFRKETFRIISSACSTEIWGSQNVTDRTRQQADDGWVGKPRNKKSLQRGWAPLEAHYTLQPTRAKHHCPKIHKDTCCPSKLRTSWGLALNRELHLPK